MWSISNCLRQFREQKKSSFGSDRWEEDEVDEDEEDVEGGEEGEEDKEEFEASSFAIINRSVIFCTFSSVFFISCLHFSHPQKPNSLLLFLRMSSLSFSAAALFTFSMFFLIRSCLAAHSIQYTELH